MSITQQIENILDKRLGRGAYTGEGRLQLIEKRIEAINGVKQRIYELDALIKTISSQIELKEGEYYALLANDPEVLSNFEELKKLYITENGRKQLKALCKIEMLLGKLDLLKQRFEREAIRIAFIGAERQGKSTFIKTITGLTDKVIPAYSGNSCTGAVSVIHNVDKVLDKDGNEQNVKVVIEYYDANEFLDMVNEKLLRFFPDGSKCIGRLEQINTLSLPDQLNLESKFVAEYNKFRESVVENYNEYKDLIGTGVQTYYDEDIIAQHVAQYEEFDKPVEESQPVTKDDGRVVYAVKYYKYVAVKNVDIFRKFEVEATKLLELVDSIGIGSAADTKAIEEEMYRILREDCDAAINLFRPGAIPNYPQEQTEILDNIERELMDREPSKWIAYVLNRVDHGPLVNTNSIKEVVKIIEGVLGGMTQKPVAWLKALNGGNFEEVKELLTSLLKLVADNLDSLDNALVEQADNVTQEAYNECLSLVKAANDVTSAGASLNADALTLFDEELYKKMLESFGREMNNLDVRDYATKRDKECLELQEAYETIIKKVSSYIPNKAKILDRFETGALVTPNQIFEEYIEQMRNDIFNAFEAVNANVLYPLQEKVKMDLIKTLYNQGLLSNMPTPYNSPSEEWMQYIIDNYVDEETYPNLHKALNFILEYQINIEGLVEYNVTRSLYLIDRTHGDFIQYRGKQPDSFEDRATEVREELFNRINPIQKKLREWIGAFTLIPSHSFYSRVHKFHIKVLTDRGGVDDFRRFYRNNMGLIWSNEISAAGKAKKAFGDWTERINNLRKVVTYENFSIK